MKKIICLFLSVLVALSVLSCNDPPYESLNYAMGASVTQKIYGGEEKEASENALRAIKELDNRISYRNSSGEIGLLNQNGSAELDGEMLGYLSQAIEISDLTKGKYDITVLPLVLLWGFDGDDMRLPLESEISKALERVGYENIAINNNRVELLNNAMLDFSAMGKGEACEKAIEEYKKSGVEGAVVTVGGSVGVYGSKNGKPFTVGIRDPQDSSGLLGTLKVTDKYISTSGIYEKKFEKDGKTYHHLLDPSSGYPVDSGLISVTVISDDGGLSDALSSACFCLGIYESMELLNKYSANAVFVSKDGSVTVTEGIADAFECGRNVTYVGTRNAR